MHPSLPMQAGLWGLLSGSALVLGALAGYFAPVPRRLIAAVMAFGSGVLISALSFELMDEAYRRGGLDSTAFGFLAGAAVFTFANIGLARVGAKHRKRSRPHEAGREDATAKVASGKSGGAKGASSGASGEAGSGAAIALGALLDGIPESIVIGVSMLGGHGVSMVAVVAIFLSNVPEGLSSAAGWRHAGRSPAYVFGVWAAIALISGAASLIGYTVFSHYSPDVVAATQAIAAGAILAMLADTMIPEAFEVAHDFAGLITVAGFLAAFALTKAAG